MLQQLPDKKHKWLVTGVAGFIGVNLARTLLDANQEVIGFDNFSTGKRENLKELEQTVGANFKNFTLIEGSIVNKSSLQKAMMGVDFVLHHAALASVPQSIKDPGTFHEVNITGFLNVLEAAHEAKVKRVVYASSSAVYGDEPGSPAEENKVGWLLSPYALSKKVNEEYAQTFEQCYGLQSVGLRYFNVFGPHQDPYGAYAAVIPLWVKALLKGEAVQIYGDGQTTRDFCFIADVVQANIKAAFANLEGHRHRVFNVAASHKTSLNELYQVLAAVLAEKNPSVALPKPVYRDFRPGDVRHSMANISRAQQFLGYAPSTSLKDGILKSLGWYQKHLK